MFPHRMHLPVMMAGLLGMAACSGNDTEAPSDPVTPAARSEQAVEPVRPHRVDSRPPPMHRPVDFWEEGETKTQVDAAKAAEEGYVVFDLGETWTPYLFTERGTEVEEPLSNTYRGTYLALARGELPRDHHGERARRDKYLELYGIMPTLNLLRERFRSVRGLECAEGLSYEALAAFEGFTTYGNNRRSRDQARDFDVLERHVERLLAAHEVTSTADLDKDSLDPRDKRRVADYEKDAGRVLAIREAQDRIQCEGFFEGGRRFTRGALDWITHEALAEFERRHRIYGWGYIGRDTLRALRRTPIENERLAVIRILTERAVHAAGIIEDGSTERDGEPRTFLGADGEQHPIPNLEAAIQEGVIAAFGLQTVESTERFLDGLGELGKEEERLVAVRGPELPEYYDSDMKLGIVVDRGDVWYDFPYNETGQEMPQPTQRRPRATIQTEYQGRQIPLARFGTTIGGWRSEYIDGALMWRYKNSPVGRRAWHQIVASPVWLPPESTPPSSLLSRSLRGPERYHVNYHETGPSYASAYGLVAAYHKKFARNAEGELTYFGDEGIRMHGSVDYMSIMRRHSHGCHRLHNHIAVRLMSFVLAHRAHRRMGQQRMAFRRELEHEGETYHLEINEGGYVFELQEPVFVDVLEGRIRGSRRTPVEHPIPRFDPEMGAYVLPDGGAVTVSRSGQMDPTSFPVRDAGVPEGGLPDGSARMSARMDAGAPAGKLNLPLPPGR